MKRLFSKRQKKILRIFSGNVCSICGVKLTSKFHGDHVRAFSAGGSTTLENGQALCEYCNLRKGATDG